MKRVRSMRWGIVVPALTVGLLALPATLAVRSSSLATVDTVPSPAPLPAIPVAATGAPRTLDGIVEHLPYIASSLPDALSTQAASEIAALDPRDAVAAQAAFMDAWSGLTTSFSDDALQLARQLMSGAVQMGDRQTRSDADQEFQVLLDDSDNAPRLSNAAVALFTLGEAQRDGRAVTDGSVGNGDEVSTNAAILLTAVTRNFTTSAPAQLRAAWLNLGFLAPLLNEGDSYVQLDALQSWLSSNSDDATVRYLLASLLSDGFVPFISGSTTQPDPLTASLQVLEPLRSDARTAALGDSAAGDAYFRAALRKQGNAPYQARTTARQALDAYDNALRRNRDPGLFAARATVLDYLGDTPDAVAAQQLAVRGAPRSAGALIDLAALEEKLCDAQGCSYAAMRDDAHAAQRLLGEQQPPRLDAARFPRWQQPCVGGGQSLVGLFDPGTERGYLGLSYGSLSDRFPAAIPATGCGGGGAFFTFTSIEPTDDPGLDDRRAVGTLSDSAASLALQASALLHDPATADRDFNAWRDAGAADLDAGGETTGQAWSGRVALLDGYDEAAHLATTPAPARPVKGASNFPPDLVLADTILRRAHRFAAAADVCRASVAALPGNDYPLKCEGEASYLDGDYAVAQNALANLYGRVTDQHRDEPGVAEDLVAADVRTQRFDSARKVLLDNAGPDETVVDEKMGEIALESNDLSGAATQFQKAITAADGSSPVVQIAHSNRGIVLLRAAQSAADQVPDCVRYRNACETARSDFQAALGMDAENPVFLLNLAWAQRLLGDSETGAATLRHALQDDPTLFPAYNDIGVVEAELGNLDAARLDFERAVTAKPDYDLALWNLGVLEMRSVGGIPRGQSLLARAITLQPTLRGESTSELRTDERIYKVELGKGTGQPFNHTYGVAAAVLGGVSLAGIAVSSLLDLGKERGREGLAKIFGERARRLVAYIDRRLGPAFRRSRARPWTSTVPVLVGLTAVVTAWTGQGTTLTSVLIASYAALLGLVVHESGHLAAAAVLHRRVRAAQSPLALGVAIIMLPLRLLGGPCVGHEVLGRTGAAVDEHDRRCEMVYAAGPLANLVVALAAGMASLLWPLPLLRVIMLVQFGMVAFSFLPVRPMEGAVLGEAHRRTVSVLLLGVVVFAVLFSEGVL